MGRANIARMDDALVQWARTKQWARREGDKIEVPEDEINRVALVNDRGLVAEASIVPIGSPGRSAAFLQVYGGFLRRIGRASKRHAVLVGGVVVMALEERSGKIQTMMFSDEALTVGVAEKKGSTT